MNRDSSTFSCPAAGEEQFEIKKQGYVFIQERKVFQVCSVYPRLVARGLSLPDEELPYYIRETFHYNCIQLPVTVMYIQVPFIKSIQSLETS